MAAAWTQEILSKVNQMLDEGEQPMAIAKALDIGHAGVYRQLRIRQAVTATTKEQPMTNPPELFPISDIDAELRPASQMRAVMSDEAIESYAGSIDRMPPVSLEMDDDGHVWLVDGAHTVSAAQMAGKTEILATLKRGSYLTAYSDACVANDRHGVRVTNADKRHRVAVALQHDEMGQWSNRMLGEHCGVSDTLVASADGSTAVKPQLERKTIGRDGKVRPASRMPEPIVVAGKSRVNGELVDDPPDVARKRANGTIPASAVPEIEEVDSPTTLESVQEDIEERQAIQDDISDEDWLETLPLAITLSGKQLETFQEDALAYRDLESARKSFQHHASRAFNKAKHKGSYLWKVKYFLGLDHPSKWVQCQDLTEGGCGGTGFIEFGSSKTKCKECHGLGYRINS